MSQAQVAFGIGVGELEGDGAIYDLYQNITCFSQRDGRVVGELNQ
jgi:hypothetical protein